MITLLLHLLRLLPFLCGGHRQLALENMALRHQASHDGSPLLGRAGQGLDQVAAVPHHRNPCYRSAVAAVPLPGALDSVLRPAHRVPPTRQRRDHRPGQENGRGQSSVGCPQNQRRASQAWPRCGRAHRLPADVEAPYTAFADLAHIPDHHLRDLETGWTPIPPSNLTRASSATTGGRMSVTRASARNATVFMAQPPGGGKAESRPAESDR